jgi:hypothetical protein
VRPSQAAEENLEMNSKMLTDEFESKTICAVQATASDAVARLDRDLAELGLPRCPSPSSSFKVEDRFMLSAHWLSAENRWFIGFL